MSNSNPNAIGSSTLFTWTIKNVDMFTEKTSKYVKSPEFSHFAQQRAKFYIRLYPRGTDTANADYLSVYIMKSTSSETECDTVYNCESGFLTALRKRHMFMFNQALQQGDGRGLQMFLDRKSLLPTDGDLTLYCSIWTEGSLDHQQTSSPDPELLELSENFEKAYEERLFTDITLQTKGGKLKVHKAMIEARLPGLAKLSGGGLENIELTTASALLRYIYTGRLNMKDLKFFDLVSSPDLSSHMKSFLGSRWREIKAETFNTRKCVSFRWKIKHFCSLMSDDVVTYSMTDSDVESWTWLDFSLSISSNKPSGDQDVLFSVKRYSRECKMIVCKISALDICKTFEHTFGEEDFWKIPAFARRDEVVDKDLDVASFHFEISLTDGKSTSFVNSIELCHNSSSSSDISDELESFRVDLGKMLKSCTRSDFVLAVRGQRFPCHRFVLASRSQNFRKTVEYGPNQISITDVEPVSVESMLHYMYTGRIGYCRNLKQALDLFELAHRYDIPGLKKESVRRIKSSLSADILGEVLLAADKWNDAELKGYVFDFVCTVPKLVLKSTRLQQILKTKSDLAVEIMNRALAGLAGSNKGSKEIEKPD